ncbi:MAG TPA: chemotaxis protein CheW [Anaeromyxobacteraceae bacterium]
MSELREAHDPAPGASWFFCLRILGGRYAFEAGLVMEVVRLGPLTRLPSAPGFLPGVFTYRGEVLPVLDVNQLLGHKPVAIRAATRAAIVRSGPWKVAVLAEQIEGLLAVRREALEAPPADAGAGAGPAEFLSAVTRDARGELAILDLPRLVDAARSRSVPA